ncbi:twin-arginine translocation signal domain-containing protein [Limnobacter sp. P1]|uniref:twin-arginine translocation signal domain-containing protein n=1 Tax=Limnobacter olei TaxID=3031298 RepID=UPI0023B0C3A3|nr:twin-arginine translocation signal domain-containing protein [Limnobacter sp. P1]
MKTIPLSIETCDEPSGEIPKLNIPLTRRSFLKGSAVLIGTIASSNVLFALAPSPVWAVELKKLSKNQGTALMQMGRVLYPHDKLSDAVYALLAKDLDAEAANNPDLADQLVQGLKKLDQQAGGSFIAASDTKKLEAVTALQGTPFFNTVRSKCVTSLYDNDMAFAAFGYPGGSWEKGGYITRGFQDLSWLPAPPEDVSPPPYMG